jgi:SNF2 family DNA or RNA helicase
MQIIANQALKVSLPFELVSEAAQKITNAEEYDDGDLVLNWEHPETQYLCHILDAHQPDPKLPQIPSPMLRDYSWPGIYTPYEHQKITSSFLSLRYRAFCFSEMGVGKSASAIWAADYLMNLEQVKRVLIICPLSIMYTAWQADIFKTAMHRSVGIAYGDKAKRKKILESGYDFTIINYDGIDVVFEEIKKTAFDLIIIDEANAYKNSSTKRWKTLAKIIMPSTRIWMMTGTPASHSPLDAYGLAKIISPSRVPKFITAWRDKVMYRLTQFKWEAKPTAKAHVFEALQPAIRYTKKECVDLPELTYEVRDIPLSPQVQSYYRRLKNQLLIEAAGEEISAVNAGAKLSKLLQVSQGAVYSDDRNVVEFDISPRLNVLQEVLDECANKAVVFVNFLHTIDVVKKHLDDHKVSNAVIKGEVTPRERAKIIDAFQQQTEPKVLIIQPQAASHGVTLTAADTIIFWGPIVSVETLMQCVGRIDRVGQKNKMTVITMMGSEAERKVYKMTQGKIQDHQAIVDLYKQILEE